MCFNKPSRFGVPVRISHADSFEYTDPLSAGFHPLPEKYICKGAPCWALQAGGLERTEINPGIFRGKAWKRDEVETPNSQKNLKMRVRCPLKSHSTFSYVQLPYGFQAKSFVCDWTARRGGAYATKDCGSIDPPPRYSNVEVDGWISCYYW